MAYVKVSVPKSGSGAGSPVPKSPNVLFIPVGDIKTFKSPEIGNVEMTAEDIILNEGAKALAVYMTPSTIKRKDTSDGDEDAVGFTSEFEGEHPGDSVAINNFIEAHINDGFVILSTECATETGTRVQGLPCNPMRMTSESQDDKDAKKVTLKFTQSMKDPFKMRHYSGALPEVADTTPPSQEPEESL